MNPAKSRIHAGKEDGSQLHWSGFVPSTHDVIPARFVDHCAMACFKRDPQSQMSITVGRMSDELQTSTPSPPTLGGAVSIAASPEVFQCLRTKCFVPGSAASPPQGGQESLK